MLDWSLLFQVKELLADSLLKAGQARQVAQELDTLLTKYELMGQQGFAVTSNLYLKMGCAYHQYGDLEHAQTAWRRGMERENYYDFINHDMTLMAESLAVYSSTFDKDSLEQYLKKSPSNFTPGISDPLLLYEAVGINFTIWFIIGLVFFIIAWVKGAISEGAQRKNFGRIVIHYVLYLFIPSTLLPIIVNMAGKRIGLSNAAILLISISGSVIPILLFIRNAIRRARQEAIPDREEISKTLIPVWLMGIILFGAIFSLLLILIWLLSVILPVFS